MSTLAGPEVFEYLGHLVLEIDKTLSQYKETDFEYLMHSQMIDILKQEERFLEYINSNGTDPLLAVSLNGFPSVTSLKPDIKSMGEVAAFSEITNKFAASTDEEAQTWFDSRFVNSGHSPVTQEQWSKELKNREASDKLRTEVSLQVEETDDSKFKLSVIENTFIDGHDQFSKTAPVLIRSGSVIYCVAWNRVLELSDIRFYVHNTSTVMEGLPTAKTSAKTFDEIKRFYSFNRSHFPGVKWPGMLKWRNKITDYSQVLKASWKPRIDITKDLLIILTRCLERPVTVDNMGAKSLQNLLLFVNIPFSNAPKTVPTEEDFFKSGGRRGRDDDKSLSVPLAFDLQSGKDRVGRITYLLPHERKIVGPYSKVSHRTTLGGVGISIRGSAMWSDSQYTNLLEALRNISKLHKTRHTVVSGPQ